jgi:hypothetical protein
MLPLGHREEGWAHPPPPDHLLLRTEPLTRPPQLLLLRRRTFQRRLPLQHPLHPPHRRIYHHPLRHHHHHLGISALTRARQLARPRRRHVNSSKRRAAGHFRHYRASLEGFSTILPGRDRTDGEAARAGAPRGEIQPRVRVGVGVVVGLDSGLGGLTMEGRETRAAVLTNNNNNNNNSSSSNVQMGQEGTYRVGMKISISLDISSSLGLPTLYFPRV